MSQHATLLAIAGLAGVIITAVLVYCILRFLRGAITLIMPRTTYRPGETITGNFILLAKKKISGNRLIVSLIGVELARVYEEGKSRTLSREIYRDEILIAGAKNYPAGHASSHDFAIVVPNRQAPEFLNSGFEQVLNAALDLLGDRNTWLEWQVEVRLDAKGVDLSAAQPVTIDWS